jgi:hypothetical protein
MMELKVDYMGFKKGSRKTLPEWLREVGSINYLVIDRYFTFVQ